MRTLHEDERDDFKGFSKDDQFIIDVKLFDEDADSTRSKFYFNGELMGYGIEDEYREVKVKGETRIPNGTYIIGFRHSPKFSGSYYRDGDGNIIRASKRNTEALKKRFHSEHELIWVLDVPGFEYILWHWGNYESNTDGCYLVGSSLFVDSKRGRAVGGSRDKYEEIYPIIWRAYHKEQKDIIVNYDR